jgi:hypothetical protein
MAKLKAFKNPRREALARLKEIKQGAQYLINALTVASTVYEYYTQTISDQSGTREIQNARPRPRRTEEYPENKPGTWGALYAEADRLTAQASALREFAQQQYNEAVARNGAR